MIRKELRDDRGNAAPKQEADKPSSKDGNAKPKLPVKSDAPVRSATGDSSDGGRDSGGAGKSDGRPNSTGTPGKVEPGGKTKNDNGSPDGTGRPGRSGNTETAPGGVSSRDSRGVQQSTDAETSVVRAGTDPAGITGGVTVESKAAEASGELNQGGVPMIFERFFKIALLALIFLGIASYSILNRYGFVHSSEVTIIVCNRITGAVSFKVAEISPTTETVSLQPVDKVKIDAPDSKTVTLTPVENDPFAGKSGKK